MNLNLDLTRGKPSDEQLALSEEMLADETYMAGNIDCRNYGILEGLPEARTLFGAYLGVPADQTFVLGNSSLALMNDLIVQRLVRQISGSAVGHLPAMICPVPGYDRHHSICELYGITMLPVRMKDDGPDMDEVERLAEDENVMGMWCVPKYSNPTGATYSYEVCRRLATMKASAGFRIIWDLAYQVHSLIEEVDELPDMLELCREAGHEDRVFVIGSTSKVTFAGAGLAMLGASKRDLAWFKESLAVQTIGPDKLNQLRHVRFLRDTEGIHSHMAKHRQILRPKFDAVHEILSAELYSKGIAWWNCPRGGYFVSLKVLTGCAKDVVRLAGERGVKLTPAGAAFPHGRDPDDSHIRIAPSFPPLHEVRQAMEVVADCIKATAK